MAEYYAVERSSEYLAHYGVKGMKWGVRKSRAKKGISYWRARRKLGQLTDEQKALKRDVSEAAKEYRVRLEKKRETRSIRGTLGLDRKSRKYREARRKLIHATNAYKQSLSREQRKRIRNHIIMS